MENLLLPNVITGVREEDVLRYALPSGFRASWVSHFDIADTNTALFERADVTGVVSVGQCPAISGENPAEAFSTRLGRTVTYEATDPHSFITPLAPMLGEQATAAIADMYRALSTQPDHSITAEGSTQKLLGVTPPDSERVAGRHRSLTGIGGRSGRHRGDGRRRSPGYVGRHFGTSSKSPASRPGRRPATSGEDPHGRLLR